MSLKELAAEFNSQIAELKKHIYVNRKQLEYFNSTKDDLKVREILMSIDYSENYVNKEQQEIQSTYFGHECFSIFTGYCYFRLANEDLKKNKIQFEITIPTICESTVFCLHVFSRIWTESTIYDSVLIREKRGQ